MSERGRPSHSIAVLGCGHWGPNHVRVFGALPGVSVDWAVDPDAARRRQMAGLHRGLRVTDRLEDVLGDPAVDGVVVATPAATHRELALAAIRAGKHVLCEKPLALTAADCAELVAAAARARVALMVGHVFVFNHGILKVKDLLDARDLGRVLYATAVRANRGPVRQDVNALFDLAAHEVSIFNFLFDAVPDTVSASARAFVRPGVEDVAFVTLDYPDDVFAGVTVSWLHPRKVRTISVVGDKKMAVFDDLSASPVSVHAGGGEEPFYASFGEFTRLARSADVAVAPVVPEEPLLRQARAFVDAIETGEAGAASGERGADVVRVLEAIGASLQAGGARTPVPPRRH